MTLHFPLPPPPHTHTRTHTHTYLSPVAIRQVLECRKSRVSDLGYSHVLEHLSCILLQPPNVDGPLLRGVQIAATHTEVAGWADHATRQPQRVVGEDGL